MITEKPGLVYYIFSCPLEWLLESCSITVTHPRCLNDVCQKMFSNSLTLCTAVVEHILTFLTYSASTHVISTKLRKSNYQKERSCWLACCLYKNMFSVMITNRTVGCNRCFLLLNYVKMHDWLWQRQWLWDYVFFCVCFRLMGKQ